MQCHAHTWTITGDWIHQQRHGSQSVKKKLCERLINQPRYVYTVQISVHSHDEVPINLHFDCMCSLLHESKHTFTDFAYSSLPGPHV